MCVLIGGGGKYTLIWTLKQIIYNRETLFKKSQKFMGFMCHV